MGVWNVIFPDMAKEVRVHVGLDARFGLYFADSVPGEEKWSERADRESVKGGHGAKERESNGERHAVEGKVDEFLN